METIKNAFAWENGGVWMWLICVVSIACLALLVERIYFIVFKFNTNARQLMEAVQRNIIQNNIDGAVKACNAASSSAVARVIKAGLGRADRTQLDIQNAIEEATLEVVPEVTRYLPTLASLANIATLLGLLGTIIGLIDSFAALKDAAPDERQEKLSSGIAIAMNTTAFGLMVAIPTLLVHTILSVLVKNIMDSIELCSTKVSNLLSQRAK